MQAFSRFLVEKINRLALLKVNRIFTIEAMNKKHYSSYTSYLIFCNIQHTIGNVIIPQSVVTNTPPSA